MGVKKIDLIKQVAEKLEITETHTQEVIQTFLDTFVENLIKEKRIELRRFGVFEVRKRKARKVRDISTGKIIRVKSYKEVEYKTSQTVKKKLNTKLKRT